MRRPPNCLRVVPKHQVYTQGFSFERMIMVCGAFTLAYFDEIRFWIASARVRIIGGYILGSLVAAAAIADNVLFIEGYIGIADVGSWRSVCFGAFRRIC